jgi:hypothetical protein
MRPFLIGLALFSTVGFLFAACGQDPIGATSTTTTSASGTGGAPDCEGVNMVYNDEDGGHPCDICLHDHCCAELSECRDQGCIDCVNYLVPSCGPKPRAVNDCLYSYCQPTCSPGWPPTSTTTGG